MYLPAALCQFLVFVSPIKCILQVLYGLLLTILHLSLFREERSGKIIAETFPFGACFHCCAVCISAPSLLLSARESDVVQLHNNRLACNSTEISSYSPRHMISSTEGFCCVFFKEVISRFVVSVRLSDRCSQLFKGANDSLSLERRKALFSIWSAGPGSDFH